MIRPRSVGVLVFENPVTGCHRGLFEVGDVDFEFGAERGGLAQGVGGDAVFVAPVAFEVLSHLTIVFHADVDEINNATENGVAKFFRVGCFTVAEVGEDRKTSHGNFFLLTPAPIGVLGFFEPAERFDNSVFAGFVTAIFSESVEAVTF